MFVDLHTEMKVVLAEVSLQLVLSGSEWEFNAFGFD
jgi:hypothetical protein